MTTFRYLITAEDAGDQIQHFLRFKQGISRKVVISLKHLPEGILLNGSHARTIDLLREGDTLEINLPDQARKLPPCEIDVPRLYWDRDVAVFNKPAGMPVHQSVELVASMEFDNENINTWKNGVERALKKYIPNGTEATGEKCENCGSPVVYQEGCLICKTCGTSKCG